jgi:hypothetical protein
MRLLVSTLCVCCSCDWLLRCAVAFLHEHQAEHEGLVTMYDNACLVHNQTCEAIVARSSMLHACEHLRYK